MFPLLVLVVGVVLMVAVATAILAWDFGRTAPGDTPGSNRPRIGVWITSTTGSTWSPGRATLLT